MADEDRSLRHLFSELFNALTFADSKLWRSLKLIIFKPGTFSSFWMEGKRVRYMKPISVFFLANLIYFIFPIFNTYNTSLKSQILSFPQKIIVADLVDERLDQDGITLEEFAIIYDAKTTELSKLLLIAMALLISGFSYLIHIRKEYNLAEHFVINLELMTFIIFVCLQGVGILFSLGALLKLSFLSETFLSILILLVLLFPIWSIQKVLFKSGILMRAINTVLMLIGIILSTFAYRIILFFVTFWSV